MKRNQALAKPDAIFLFLFLRFGFSEFQLATIWQSEIVRMAFRSYIRGEIEQGELNVIVYSWLRRNKEHYISKRYQLVVFTHMRNEVGSVASSLCTSQTL